MRGSKEGREDPVQNDKEKQKEKLEWVDADSR
jgi:hypothetical protein